MKRTFTECFAASNHILMEGALGERLKHEYQITYDAHIDMGALVLQDNSRAALKELWLGYAKIAARHNLPFMATTPTRRTDKRRIGMTIYKDTILRENVSFLKSVCEEADAEMFAGALLGCHGEAYTGTDSLGTEDARDFHKWEVERFASEPIDFFLAGLMPNAGEALGMSMAIAETDIPYIISFTLKKNGCLPDGTRLADAIRLIDENVARRPVCYMTNCVHPIFVKEALMQDFNQTDLVKTRFNGIQSNASAMDFDDMNYSTELLSSEPAALANALKELLTYRNLKIIGGCCGTDTRHMEEMARVL